MADTDRDTGTQDRMQGIGNEIKGRVEQGVGGLTGDREQQLKGAMDEGKGNLQQGMGDLKDSLSNADNDTGDNA